MSQMLSKINFGLIGCGHWGPNYARLLQQTEAACLSVCADLDPNRLRDMQKRFPDLKYCIQAETLLEMGLDAIIIATPAQTHYALVKSALEADIHVLCEKPLTLSSQESEELTQLALQKDLILMVGHTFLFNSGIQVLKQYLAQNLLGRIYYVHATRCNLGPIRQDVNVLWDLATHDISILNYLFDAYPVQVSARGQSYLQDDLEDVGFLNLKYASDMMAQIQVSWIYPIKTRQLTIVGSNKMIVWDDMNTFEPIRIYDATITQEPFYQDFGQFQLLPKQGSTTIPRVELREPLKEQFNCFLSAMQNGFLDRSGGLFSTEVIRTLEALDYSMKHNGKPINL